MLQGDTFEFRIAGVGMVYVTGFTDDRSRYRVRSGVYLHKSANESVDAPRRALRKGRSRGRPTWTTASSSSPRSSRPS